MSKKKLLSEAQIRRFQGLAGLPALGEVSFSRFRKEETNVDEMDQGYMGQRRDEEEPELPGDEGPVDDMGLDAEEPGDEEMGAELELSDEGGDDLDLSPEQKESLAADIVRAVAQELGNALDLDEPIQVDVEDDLGGEMDLELGDDLGGDLDVEEPAPAPEDELALEGNEEEEELAEVLDDEAIVNEVLRRVVARLANK